MNISNDAEIIAQKVGIPADVVQPMVNDLGYLLNDGATTTEEAEAFLEDHYGSQVHAGVRWNEIVDSYIRNQHNTPENLL